MASLTAILVCTSFSDRPKRGSTVLGREIKVYTHTKNPQNIQQNIQQIIYPCPPPPPPLPSPPPPHAAAYSIHHKTIALRRWKTTTTMPWPVALPVHSLCSRRVHLVHLHPPTKHHKHRSVPVVQINYDWRQCPLSLLPVFLCPGGHAWARH